MQLYHRFAFLFVAVAVASLLHIGSGAHAEMGVEAAGEVGGCCSPFVTHFRTDGLPGTQQVSGLLHTDHLDEFDGTLVG